MATQPKRANGTYSSYLALVGGVDKREIDDYVRWAREFLRRGYGRLDDRDEALRGFSKDLQSNQPPWELARAVAAVRHYWYWLDRAKRRESTAEIGNEETGSETETELLHRCREVLRLQHKSYRTEQSYLGWVRRFLRFYGGTPPEKLGAPEARHYLTNLAIERRVAAQTRKKGQTSVFSRKQIVDILYRMYRQIGHKARLSHEVADHILMLIQDGQLKPGDQLPSEQELTQLFGLSRPTIREAIHSLVARNILDVTHGRGTFVSQNPGVETDPLGLNTLPAEQLQDSLPEARLLIEPGVAGLAAKNATEEDIEEIETHLADMEQIVQEGGVSMSIELEFHRSIANASKNVIIRRIIPIIIESIMRTYSNAHRTGEEHAMALEEHKQIVEAIRDRKVPQAEQAMRRHLEKSSARTLAKLKSAEAGQVGRNPSSAATD